MSRHKALFLLPADAPGGAERVTAVAAAELAARFDWEVEIAVIAAAPTDSFLKGLRIGAHISYGRGRGGALTEAVLLPRLLSRPFDLVVSTHIRLNAFVAVARAIGTLRCRRLVTRESTVLLDRFGGARALAYRALYRTYGSQDAIVAQSAYMADRLKAVLPRATRGKVLELANPVDCTAIGLAAEAPLEPALAARLAARPHLVWCGRLIDVKQPVLAVETLAEARAASGEDLGLAMIGEGPLAEAVTERAAQLGLEEAVVLLGRRANPFAVFRAGAAGLLTSRHEGFPNVLLEMMASGLSAIVATPCAGGLTDLGVAITQGFGAAELGQAVVDALARQSLLAPMQARALAARDPATFVDALLGQASGPGYGAPKISRRKGRSETAAATR